MDTWKHKPGKISENWSQYRSLVGSYLYFQCIFFFLIFNFLHMCAIIILQIFMHKSMQMQLQQRGGGAASVGSSSFGSSGGLEISKPHQCQQCLKSFSSNHQLVQHIRVHTGEKPYKCSYCERRFKQLSHVQQHTRLHTGKCTYSILFNLYFATVTKIRVPVPYVKLTATIGTPYGNLSWNACCLY